MKIIIVGAGEVGYHFAEWLAQEKKEVVTIDIAPEIQKVALIRNPDYINYREALTRDILNIGLVINPEMEVVNSILRILGAPEVEEVNDFMGGRLKML